MAYEQIQYDKKLFIDNVYFLAKEKDLKIGEIEAACGVSSGYLSRLRQGEKNVAPGADFLLAISAQLSASVDALLSYDFTSATESEAAVLRYLDKLIRETETRKLSWQEDMGGYADTIPVNPEGRTPHPLYLTIPVDGSESEPFYHSKYHPSLFDLVPVKCYGCIFPGERVLYLVQVWNTGDNPSSPGDWTELELVMTGRGLEVPVPLGHTNHEKASRLDAAMNQLFAVVEDAAVLPQLTPDARAIIDEYLTEKGEAYGSKSE